ncbi:peroxisomal membrane protein PEX14 isoform X3 [Cylas formicarius]|uniref:peroxisomal membrane protein PEX14 isoform X2 n=1 Tax=Cylas formicarius TaxID=197179 RepID=UPI002958A835|nr:peroxisomal membrane protein PEX14 isoform X2 [Cylas formicarius]XP_060528560.1 peroxisomal membrane protein PEX14 isoform X3 [Cylas formicarius]
MASTEVSVETKANSDRNDLVDTAIKFLQNPKVINSPLSQKQQFLQRRGLTEEEIRIACEKSGAYEHHDKQQDFQVISTQPYNAPANIYSQVTILHKIKEIAHNIAIFSVVAYVIHKLYEMYIAPFLFGKKKKDLDDKLETFENNMRSSISEIRNDICDVKAEIDKINSSPDNEVARQLKDFKSELSTVKGLLLTRKQFPSVNAPVVPPSIPAWQMSSVQDSEHDNEPDVDHEESKEELMEVGSGSGSSEPEHFMKTSESSLEIICHEDIA